MTVIDWIAIVGGFIRENNKCLMSHSSISRSVFSRIDHLLLPEPIIYDFYESTNSVCD